MYIYIQDLSHHDVHVTSVYWDHTCKNDPTVVKIIHSSNAVVWNGAILFQNVSCWRAKWEALNNLSLMVSRETISLEDKGCPNIRNSFDKCYE